MSNEPRSDRDRGALVLPSVVIALLVIAFWSQGGGNQIVAAVIALVGGAAGVWAWHHAS